MTTSYFTPFSELSEAHRSVLMNLTLPSPSAFRAWLKDVNQSDKYANLVLEQDQIIAWSAGNFSEQPLLRRIGVFVKPEYRGRGLARTTIDELLQHISGITPQPLAYWYEQSKTRLFKPALAKYNLPDFYNPEIKKVLEPKFDSLLINSIAKLN